MNTGMLILAAGSASRMQQPKMLLPFAGETILAHVIREAITVQSGPVCLVTGHYHTEILQLQAVDMVPVVYHEEWRKGMAGSIAKGVSWMLEQDTPVEAVIILVSDQPFLHHTLLAEMIQVQQSTRKGIVAAKYGEVSGTPVLFTRNYFHELQELQGDKGAKSILQSYPHDIATVDFPDGAIDIDTPEDYERFCANIKQKHA